MVSGRKPQSSDSAGSCCLRRVGVGRTAAVSGFLPLTARGCGLPLAVSRPSQGLYGMNSGVLWRCAAVWRGLSVMLAEGVGFEPTDHLGVSGFQDRRIRPLCHPSALILWYQPAPAVFGRLCDADPAGIRLRAGSRRLADGPVPGGQQFPCPGVFLR